MTTQKPGQIVVRTRKGRQEIVGVDLNDLPSMVLLAHRLGFKGW
jgi:hypothetical protein